MGYFRRASKAITAMRSDRRVMTFIVIAVLVAAGAVLRGYRLGAESFWIDEGFTVMQTRAIVAHGYPLLASGSIESKDILLPYLTAPLTMLFGEREAVYRFWPVVFGVLAIILSYLVGRELFSNRVGLLFSFFITFSYWHIAWSRQARGYSLLVFFSLLALWFLVRYGKSHRAILLWASMGALVFGTLAKFFGALLFIPFLVVLFLERRFREAVALLLVGAVIAGVFRHLLVNAVAIFPTNHLLGYLFEYYWAYFGLFVPMGLVGLFLAYRERGRLAKVHLFSLIFLFGAFIVLSFAFYLDQKRYLFFTTHVFLLYGAFFLVSFSDVFRSRWTKASLLLLVLLLNGMLAGTFVFAPRERYVLERYTPQPDFRRAYAAIREDMQAGDFLISAYPFMDLIYLGKSDAAIPISYTGRAEDTTVGATEYYSGVKRLVGRGEDEAEDELRELALRGNLYIVLDRMASARMDPDLRSFIIREYAEIFRTADPPESRLTVYKLSER